MKVLIVIPTLDRSGAEKQFCLLAEGLAERGVEVEVLALTRGGPLRLLLEESGISVTVLGKRYRCDVSLLFRLRACIAERQPDVILSCLFSGNAYTRLALLGRRQRPRVVISERCVDSWKSGWQLKLDRLLREHFDLMIANSQSVADFYGGQGISADRIRVIPNGMPVPPHPHLNREELCETAGIPTDAKLIAFVGRLASQKCLKDLVWGMQMLRFSQPNAYLLLIGDGPQRAELEQFVIETETTSNVRFLGHREDAATLLHLVDQFWLGSEFEGMSNSLMEAMACGKPVIVSDIPANRELVDHGREGWVVNLGDGPAFAQYGQKLFENTDAAAAMGELGRQKIVERFSVDAMVEMYFRMLQNLCE